MLCGGDLPIFWSKKVAENRARDFTNVRVVRVSIADLIEPVLEKGKQTLFIHANQNT
jgi:hypothetical protein